MHLLVEKSKLNIKRFLELCLLYLFILIACLSLFGFYKNFFVIQQELRYSGWPITNFSRFEISGANLSLATIALLCLWLRDNFWLAAIILNSCLAYGAAYDHFIQIKRFHGFFPGSPPALLLALTIIIPTVTIIVYLAYLITCKLETQKYAKKTTWFTKLWQQNSS
jgi:hypothetical protein